MLFICKQGIIFRNLQMVTDKVVNQSNSVFWKMLFLLCQNQFLIVSCIETFFPPPVVFHLNGRGRKSLIFNVHNKLSFTAHCHSTQQPRVTPPSSFVMNREFHTAPSVFERPRDARTA